MPLTTTIDVSTRTRFFGHCWSCRLAAPILYFVIPRVIAGSRRPTRGINEAPKKNISTSKVRISSGAKAASPTTLTDFCRRIKKHDLQSEVEGIENNDPLKRGKALFKLVAMASVDLWTDMLEFENLHTSFGTTNSDVVMVEALYGFGASSRI